MKFYSIIIIIINCSLISCHNGVAQKNNERTEIIQNEKESILKPEELGKKKINQIKTSNLINFENKGMPIEEIFFDPISKKNLRVIAPESDNITKILLPNNMVVTLEKWEKIIDYYNNRITTYTSNDLRKTILKTYEVLTEEVKTEKSLEMDGLEYTIFPLKVAGKFIVSDWWDSGGGNVEIYDQNLKLLNQIIPLENGFESVFVKADEEITSIVADPGQHSGFNFIKQILIDNQSNEIILNETFNTIKSGVSHFNFSNGYSLMCSGYNQLSIITRIGTLHQFNAPCTYGPLIVNKDNLQIVLFSNSYKKFFAYHLTSGELIWEKPLYYFYPNYSKRTLPRDIKVLPNGLIICLIGEQGTLTIPSNNSTKVVIFNEKGEISKSLDIGKDFRNSRILTDGDHQFILGGLKQIQII